VTLSGEAVLTDIDTKWLGLSELEKSERKNCDSSVEILLLMSNNVIPIQQ
jgi:hypothetical protein